jgi:PAS domain S-box-containing protein
MWRIKASSGSVMLTFAHQAAGHMNGYRREELIGQSIDILNIKKGKPDDFAAVVENLRCEVVIHGVEVGHRHKDGHIFPIEYSTTL